MSADAPPVSPLLVLELWGLGDLALSIPFLRQASRAHKVTLLAKPIAGPLLRRFAPEVELVPFAFPWTAFSGKYRLLSWEWKELRACLRGLRRQGFGIGVSARPDPRDHLLLKAADCDRRLGFPRLGSGMLLTEKLSHPVSEHRAAAWEALALALKLPAPAQVPVANAQAKENHIVIHMGAGHPVRRWPEERWRQVAAELEWLGWRVTLIDDPNVNLEELIRILETAERFVGSDSGPGHVAALLGIPTFTLFGPQLPSRFAPAHPLAAWHAGSACPYKPCKDACRLARPECMLRVSAEDLLIPLRSWLDRKISPPSSAKTPSS